jgi:DNA-binding transcriptional LysR family regulator
MDIRQLRLFCRIVERRSFSLAAQDLHITQPAASQQVQSLERELKTLLLDRSNRTIVTTDAGQILYRYAREILDLQERAATEIVDLGEHIAGRIVMGASTGPGEHVLPSLLTGFKQRFPAVAISLFVDDTQRVVDRVVARELELGAIGAPAHRPELVVEPFVRDEVVLVCAAGHSWKSRESVTLQELAAEPQIVQQPGAGLRVVVEEQLRAAGLRRERMNVVMELGLMESAKQAAIAGAGVTFLSIWSIRNELERGDLAVVVVDGLDIRREFYIVRSRTRVLSRAADALLAFLREQYEATAQPSSSPD